MINLPELAFEKNSLHPLISQETISFHYGKHHQGYVNNLNGLISELPAEFNNYSVEEILMNIDKVNSSIRTSVFNNAGQIYNHNLYWESLKSGDEAETLDNNQLMSKISDTFGSIEKFSNEWKTQGLSIFGSGWLWLVSDEEGNLSTEKTFNADTQLIRGKKCLLVMDVWEHAYYLDYQNNRGGYIDAFLELINWNGANQRYTK